MVDIRRCTVAELQAAPNLADLLAEYARESAMPEIGEPNPQEKTYEQLEAAGVLHPVAAFEGDKLLGFILPLVSVLPHYGVLTAVIESFFVLKEERKHGIGLALLASAESLARDLGAKALLLSAPVGSPLTDAMGGLKRFRHSNDVFVTSLA